MQNYEEIIFNNLEKRKVIINQEKTDQEIIAQAKKCDNLSQMMEWRIDYYEHATEIDRLLALNQQIHQQAPQLQILTTFRSQKLGGKTELCSEDAYLNLVELLINFNFGTAIDIELDHTPDRVNDLIKKATNKHLLIREYHN